MGFRFEPSYLNHTLALATGDLQTDKLMNKFIQHNFVPGYPVHPSHSCAGGLDLAFEPNKSFLNPKVVRCTHRTPTGSLRSMATSTATCRRSLSWRGL